MKTDMKKAMKSFVLALLMLVSTGITYLVPVAASSGAAVSESDAAAVAAEQAFTLDMTAAENADDSSIIDMVISVKDIKQELNAVEFVLNFDKTLVEGVITESGDPMNAFMTVTPMYTFVVPGATATEVPVTRYEQICTYDAANGNYVCRFIDLLKYDFAKEGEEYRGLINDYDLVITIPFRIRNGVAEGTEIPFTATGVKGTTRDGLNSVKSSNVSSSYRIEVEEEPVVNPEIKLRYPSLAFTDEIVINVYYQTAGLENALQMGLIVYSSNVSTWSVFNAEEVVPGYEYNAETGLYVCATKGIAAKCLGDTKYFAVYALLSDGSYIYSKLVSYSPKTYAYNKLTSGTADTKALMVAMLNYGAAAQTYFNYNTNALVNSGMTAAQTALISPYSASMMKAVGSVDSSKVGIFTNSGGFARKYPAITFEGAFSIKYYMTPSYVPSGNVRLFYWSEADYNATIRLTSSNATGCLTMVDDGTGVYSASITGIAAKDLDGIIYVAAGYTNNGTSYCTGILAYSIGAYCVSRANVANDLQPLAKATAVYGYYAKKLLYQAV